MLRSALKVVESPSFFTSNERLWDDSSEGHSLHYVISYPYGFGPELPHYFIERYTRRGQVVLDPFCGGGTTALESALMGRIFYASDNSPFSLRITQAKLSPVDIGAVTVWIQGVHVTRPIGLDLYRKGFQAFYDPDTFREIYHLRHALLERMDRASCFVALLAASLLHGHTAGYFSAYSLPQISLSFEEQERLNVRRRQSPDYRAVMPRILRKAALALRDGAPSIMEQALRHSRCELSDARDLSFVPSSSVDLVVTAPPRPGAPRIAPDQWLRLWFLGMNVEQLARKEFVPESVPEWLDFMNEVLLELARVVRSGGRAVFDVREVKLHGKSVLLDELVMSLVDKHLSRYWEGEGLFVHPVRSEKIKDKVGEREPLKASRLLVLRRR